MLRITSQLSRLLSICLIATVLLFVVGTPLISHAQYSNEVDKNLTTIGYQSPCGIFGISPALKCLAYFLANILNMFLWALGWCVGVIGNIFTIFAAYALSGAMFDTETIDIGWKLVRDVGNVAFIFILLYIGVSTILDIGAGSSNKLIARVIIAVLLMNFSLPLAKIPIDASNVFAIAFYNAIEGGEIDQTDGFNLPKDSALENVDVAGALMASFDPQRLFKTVKIDGKTVKSANLVEILVGIIVNSIFAFLAMILLIYVFLTGVVIFLMRIVALWVVLIFSPAAVIAWAAGMDGLFKKWKTYLVNYSIVAPIYMFFIYMTVRLANSSFIDMAFQDAYGQDVGWGMSAVASWAAGNAIFLTGYFILLFFLQSGARTAKELGIAGAGAIDQLGNKFKMVGKMAALATPAGAGLAAMNIAQTTLVNPVRTRTVDRGLRGIYDRSKERADAELEGTAPRSGLIRRTGRNLTMRATSAALGQTEDRIKEYEKEFSNVHSADELKLAISSPFISAEKAMAGMRVLADKFKDFKPFGTFDPQKFESTFARYKKLGVNVKGIEDVDPRFAGYGKETQAERDEEIRKSVSKRANKERVTGYDKGIYKDAQVGKAITEGIIDGGKLENLIAQQQHSAEGERRLIESFQEMLNDLHAKGKATGKDNVENLTIALQDRGVGHLGHGIAKNNNAIEIRALVENLKAPTTIQPPSTPPGQSPAVAQGRAAVQAKIQNMQNTPMTP